MCCRRGDQDLASEGMSIATGEKDNQPYVDDYSDKLHYVDMESVRRHVGQLPIGFCDNAHIET